MNVDAYRKLLEELKIQHRDMDDAINALRLQDHVDQLQIARLKKRKLELKDKIIRIENDILPDIIA